MLFNYSFRVLLTLLISLISVTEAQQSYKCKNSGPRSHGGLRVARSLLTQSRLVVGGPTANTTSLRDCLSRSKVPFVDEAESQYSELLQNLTFNTRLPWYPVAIVQPTTPEQVSNTVTCAHKSGTKVSARSGGHSYGNFGLGGADGHLTIDLSAFQGVTLNGTIATVGGGIKLGVMAQKLNKVGRAMPHGTCPG